LGRDIILIHPTGPVVISTVSAAAKELINRQIPSNGEFAVTDASLKKSAVGPGYTLIPLPAFTYNRNEGSWIGALTPIFRANGKGQIEDIFAPLYLHNKLVGETLTFNYFGYRAGTRQYHAILSAATKIERVVDLSYKDTGLHDGRYILGLQANAGKSAFNRFFGFGNKVGDQMESAYTMGDSNLVASGGVNLAHSIQLVATERFRHVTIENSVISTLPQTLQAFPTAPGIDGADVWGQGVALSYDTRDNQLTPLKGTCARAAAEFDESSKTDNRSQWWRVGAEVRDYRPHADDRAVFVSHFLIDAVPIDSKGLVRESVPFYERPTLGGENSLRGFGRGRFVSSFAVLFNFEERIAVAQRSIMGNVIELGLTPFLDFGRVGRSFGSNGIVKDMQFNPGIGVRLLARPNIASRLDVAYGHDGANVFVGLDYPF
jgi:outer membrane protein assembly factor BamA